MGTWRESEKLEWSEKMKSVYKLLIVTLYKLQYAALGNGFRVKRSRELIANSWKEKKKQNKQHILWNSLCVTC